MITDGLLWVSHQSLAKGLNMFLFKTGARSNLLDWSIHISLQIKTLSLVTKTGVFQQWNFLERLVIHPVNWVNFPAQTVNGEIAYNVVLARFKNPNLFISPSLVVNYIFLMQNLPGSISFFSLFANGKILHLAIELLLWTKLFNSSFPIP